MNNPIDLNALGFKNTERRKTVRERNDADRKRLRDPTPAEWRARLAADELTRQAQGMGLYVAGSVKRKEARS